MPANVVQHAVNFDLERALFENTFASDKRMRTLVLALLAINIVAFFFFIAHHPIHNHSFRMPWLDPHEQYHHGRWFSYVVFKIMHQADIPVLGPLYAIAMSVGSALFLLKLWKFDLTRVEEFVVLAMFTTFPMFLAAYFYTWSTPVHHTGLLLAVSAIYACKRLHIKDIALGAALVLLMMASYQPMVTAYATLGAVCLIGSLAGVSGSGKTSLFSDIKPTLARIAAAAIGGAGYLASLKLLNVRGSHATSTIDIADLPARFMRVADASFQHLWLTQPEFHTPMKLLLGALLAAAILLSLFQARRHIMRIPLILLAWVGVIIATKTAFLITSDNTFWQYRLNPGFSILYAFCAGLILHTLTIRPLRSLALLATAFILVRFVQADLIRQEVLLRGQMQDLATANRILDRIETLPDIDFDKTYDLVRVGILSLYRREIIQSRGHAYQVYGETHMDHAEVSGRWVDEEVMRLLGSRIKFKLGIDLEFQRKADEAKKTILKDRKPWPHKDSVFIHGDTIYVYMM